MKISEVEERVGITKKNIRFYETQGLPLLVIFGVLFSLVQWIGEIKKGETSWQA